MSATEDNLISLRDVPSLDQETVLDWHREHLNPALISLMELGGYDRIRVVKAEGPWVHTADGRKLLDLISSYGALSHGHNHPRVVAAARWYEERSAADLLKEFPSPYTAALARNLSKVTPGDLDAVFFCNSGTEAVEGALKLSMRYFEGKRDRFVYAENSLHGKTLGTLSVTGREKYREHVRRFHDWPMVPFGDAAALEEVFAADQEQRIAGIVLEPIQGEAGVIVPPAGYLRAAADIARRHGALLILDEIQTGFGRTGSFFRCEAEDVVPDILCLAKSLGGGVATIGATITRREIQRKAYGRINHCLVHTSTFGGRARSAAVSMEALAVAIDEDFAGRAAELGAWLKGELERVRDKHPDVIRSIRGHGLMLGLEFHPVKLSGLAGPLGALGLNRIVDAYFPGIFGAELLHHHDILSSFVLNNPRVLRIYPALVATRDDLSGVPRALDEVLSKGVSRIVGERVADATKRVGLKPLREWLKSW